MLVIPLLTACLAASRGEKTQVPTAADSHKPPARARERERSEGQEQGSSLVALLGSRRSASTAAAKDGIQRQKQYIL